MLNFITKLFGGNKQDKDVKSMQPIVDKVNIEYAKLGQLSNDELRGKTLEFREAIQAHLAGINEDIEALKTQAAEEKDFEQKEYLFEEIDKLIKERDKNLEDILEELLPEAFAVVKETAKRFTEMGSAYTRNGEELVTTATQHDRELAATGKSYVRIEGDKAYWKNHWDAAGAKIEWAMVHYDVQLMGGYSLHKGKIAEMQTGEGKTLVATLPAYINGLAGYGVHVVTVNDYLARRDAEWIGPIMEFLLLTIDCIDKYDSHSDGRKKAYNCDITYGTNNEFGFDYLRDNMVRNNEDKVQGKHHFAMVDEIDSVLIDDARTPLIISGPISQGSDTQEYNGLKPRVEALIDAQRKLAQDFLNSAKKKIRDGDAGPQEGEGGLDLFRAFRAMPKYRPLIKFMGELGMKAIVEKTENFYLQEQGKNMPLADEPLYFSIVEKNRSIDLTDKGAEFLAKGQDDINFFVMPDIAAVMQDIEATETMTHEEQVKEKERVLEDFSIKSQRLHATNQLLKAYTLFEKDVDYLVADEKVKIIDEQTGRTMDGRRYSDGLHQALEAKENVKIEAATQTYATVTLQNFFRMYHKLCGMTGTAETEAKEFYDIYALDVVVVPTNKPVTRDDREDLVYKTEREKFNAIIDEIESLVSQKRPILVGTTSVDVSERLSRTLRLRKVEHNVLNAKRHQQEAQIVADAGKPGQVTIATNMAGRGTDIKISAAVKKAGGLAIIGTERHDSRRVDRQLRGRAGRQGDPGSSQFYVSLEDKLMRMFHSERITKLMDRMGHQEGEVIQHSMVTKSIERAQERLEENNFGTRKRLLDYDDVMNIQREVIYKRRRNALSGERLSVDIYNMLTEFAQELFLTHKHNSDYEHFEQNCLLFLGIEPNFSEAEFNAGSDLNLAVQFEEQAAEFYAKKMSTIRKTVLPTIKNVFETEGERYKNIAIPFTDGKKGLNLVVNLEEAVGSDGGAIVTELEKGITLALIDDNWKEHLRSMDELKDASFAAQFEQKDPLVVYKKEAYDLFKEFVSDVNREVTNFLLKGTIQLASPDDVKEARAPRRAVSNKTKTNRTDEQPQGIPEGASGGGEAARKVETMKREQPKVGRNEPCPCGSGKKFKQCHGKK
jgi:preprotein translocase subunit SecA